MKKTINAALVGISMILAGCGSIDDQSTTRVEDSFPRCGGAKEVQSVTSINNGNHGETSGWIVLCKNGTTFRVDDNREDDDMQRSDIQNGDELVFVSQASIAFNPDADGHVLERTLNYAARVEVLDKNASYDKPISRFSSTTRPAKGIRIKIIEAAYLGREDYVAGSEIVIPSASALKMPWAEFEKRTKQARDEMARDRRERESQEAKMQGLEERANDLLDLDKGDEGAVEWDGEVGEWASFSLKPEALTKLIDAYANVKARGDIDAFGDVIS